MSMKKGKVDGSNMRPEYDFSQGVVGKYAQRDPNVAKTRITIYIDDDVLAYFKNLAREAGAAPYQTQINTVLRQAMEGGAGSPAERLLRDERFIEAVAERVRSRKTKAHAKD